MKTKTKLSLALAVLAAFAIMCFAGIQNVWQARADGENVFEMVQGASLKLNEQGGIRFRVKMDKYWRDLITEEERYQLRGMITTKTSYDEAKGNISTITNAIVQDLDEAKIYEDEFGNYFANLCLTEVTDRKGYAVGVAFVYDVTEDRIYETAKINADLTRGSLYDLANSATLSTASDYVDELQGLQSYNSWYGTEAYPIVIQTHEQYIAFLGKIAAGKNFAAQYVKVYRTALNGAELDASMPENTTIVEMYTVTFYDEDKTTVLKTESFTGSKDIVPPTEPAKATDADYLYSFNKWVLEDGSDATLSNVSESLNVYASYSKYSLRPMVGTATETFEGKVFIENSNTAVTDNVSVRGMGVQFETLNEDGNTRLKANVSAGTSKRWIIFKYTGLEAGKTYVVDFDMNYTEESGGTASDDYSFWINEHGDNVAAATGNDVNRISYLYLKTLQRVSGSGLNNRNTINGDGHYTFLFTATKSGCSYFTIRCNDSVASTVYFDNFKLYNQAGSMPAYSTAVEKGMTAAMVERDGEAAVFAYGNEKNKVLFFALGGMTSGSKYTITFKAEVLSADGTAVSGKINAFAFGIGRSKAYSNGGWTTGSGSDATGYGYNLYTPAADGTVTLTVTATANDDITYLFVRTQTNYNDYKITMWDIGFAQTA